MNNMYQNFVNLYPVSKTLRFELKPQGKTLENIKQKGIIDDDEHKAESYIKIKKIMDEYHKYFIEETLKNYQIDINTLEEYDNLIKVQNKDNKKIDDIKKKMKKDISDSFTKNKDYKKIFGKEMITQYLPAFVKQESELELIKEFDKFTTYFQGFYENRKNIYDVDKSTSIAYRIIDENLPIFISNMKLFKYIKEALSEETIKQIYKDLEEIIQVNKIDEMFELEYFNDVLSQKGIDVYNQVIGGISKEDGTKIKGINEYVNEYKQKHPENSKIGKLNILYKQILTDSQTASFVIEKIEDDAQLIEMVKSLAELINSRILNSENNLESLLKNISTYDIDKIYIKNDISITEISQKLFDDWDLINQGFRSWYDEKQGDIKKVKNKEKYENERKKFWKNNKNVSIEMLNTYVRYTEKAANVEKYFEDYKITNMQNKEENIFKIIEQNYKVLQNILNFKFSNEKNLKEDNEKIEQIKEYLDSLKELQGLVKKLMGARFDADKEKDNNFYDKLYIFWDVLQEITPVYNKVRNYLTGKVYSTDKIKLNFANPTLLDGWDVNKESENKCVILRKNNLYYLAIFDKEFKGTLQKEQNAIQYYEKIDYKLLPSPNKMLPKVFFSNKNIEFFNPSQELLNKYEKGLHKKGDKFNKKFCHELINFFKQSINSHEDWKKFNFVFTETDKYNDISEFYKEVESQGYKISFSKIDENYLNELVDEGKVYLFQIYNKDFSEYSHGTPNLHTLYWKMLFDEENLKNIVYKLNGKAEIFYRRASIERKVTHPKEQPIKNKNEKNVKKQSMFNYDLIKNKRFTEDKFQFHVPITLNFNNIGISNINKQVNQAIKNDNENYIIGIDRGERHLLYLVLIDSKGNIVEQYSLNNIINSFNTNNNKQEIETDYHKLLDYKEKNLEKEKQSWQSIENIKELKEGYLSQAINKITDLMIKYNAIIVLEDLNMGFIRGRQKFEKQVYQKFEKMLIDKLNYLAKKNKDIYENGSILKAYQLTNKFESFRKLGKQSGVLFHIPAWNTSKIDPVTGFVNLFYIKYESEAKAKDFVSKIDSITYNKEKGYFEFDIDYNKFSNRAEGTKIKWKLCTYGNRIKTTKSNYSYNSEEINLSEAFEKLFISKNIDYKTKNFRDRILEADTDSTFWKEFIKLFKLMLQMRNSVPNTVKDYIISPVANEKGEFFNSEDKKEGLPNDADANGAYNIARKGLWIVNQIKQCPDEQLGKIKLAISNKEWLQFIQNKLWEE